MMRSENSFSRLMHWRNIMYRTSAVIDMPAHSRALLHAGTVCALVLFFTLMLPAYTHAVCDGNGNDIDASGKITGIACPDPIEAPPSERAATLSNDGIFGCLGQGARVANVGTLSAIGGIYVPVNDAAVTLNTGFLVYKECILDGVSRKIAESGTAEMGRQALMAFNQGRNGSAQYVRNLETDLAPFRDTLVVNAVTRAQSSQMCNAFKSSVPTAYARNYYLASRNGGSAISCSFPGSDGDRQAMVGGTVVVNWSSFGALIRPENYEVGNYYLLKAQNEAELATFDANTREMLGWSNGVFPLFDNEQDPLGMNVQTPGFIIAQSIQQIVGSGYRQLENATEIDQVVANLWGGLTTQLISDTRGLTGLAQSLNGQPSYLDRMVAQTSANVRQQAANAALGIIGAARQIEASYRQAKEGIATALSNAIVQLRSAEAQCWNLIIPAVQARAAQGTQTCTPGQFGGQPICTTTGGNVQLNIATSTQFSQQIIDSQIAPLATTTVRDIRASDAAIALLNQLIASVTNSASASNQQQALF